MKHREKITKMVGGFLISIFIDFLIGFAGEWVSVYYFFFDFLYLKRIKYFSVPEIRSTRKGEETPLKARIEEGLYREKPPSLEETISSEQEARARAIRSLVVAEAGSITTDTRTNQIIIRDYPEKLNEYGKIIEHLDKPMKMIKIDLIIVEASKDFARAIGVGTTAIGKRDNKTYAYGTSEDSRNVVDEAREGTVDTVSLIPLLDVAAGEAISSFGLAGTFLYEGSNTLLANTLALAETKGVSRTINKSSLITMDNLQAIVEAQNIVTYKIQSGGTNPVVESREIEAGLKLTVTPHIVDVGQDNWMIELVMVAERSTFLAARTDGIPEKASTNLTTQAIIGDNATLVVGGFFDNRYLMSETGVPCLMNIPGLGYLFKAAGTQNPKSNILFFLTPTVISLDKIPYASPEVQKTIKEYQQELEQIDPDKRNRLIEKYP